MKLGLTTSSALVAAVTCLFVSSPTVAWADSNVAFGKNVSLHGTFGSASYLTSSLTDGKYLPKNNYWQSGTVWWNDYVSPGNYVDIDLAGTFTINSLNLQADDNDAYVLDYLGKDNLWHRAWDVPNYDFEPYGMQTRPNPYDNTARYQLSAPITAKGLRFYGNRYDSDRLFAVSEIQAYGVTAVPEPGAAAFAAPSGASIIGLIAHRRRKA